MRGNDFSSKCCLFYLAPVKQSEESLFKYRIGPVGSVVANGPQDAGWVEQVTESVETAQPDQSVET